MTESTRLRTPLFALHQSLGARLVPFAGYEMPVQYPTGIIKEHLHTRTAASLFDVSHMGQLRISGRDAAAGLESLMPNDIVNLPVGRQRYGFFTNENGGILDDLMVANFGEFLLVVVNAACKEQDLTHLRTELAPSCTIENLEDRALLALQGPTAASVISDFSEETSSMAFMDAIETTLLDAECFVSRSGYTGEDGFEISVPATSAEALARELLSHPDVAPAGLGARDSLRLEAGLCLYGHDIDASTSPVEARLTFALSKSRRPGGERPGGYPGADAIQNQLKSGAARQRVGLAPNSRTPVRADATLFDPAGNEVGFVTSGGFGPTLDAPVAMGYVASSCAAVATELAAEVRGKRVPIRVASMPTVPHRYMR